MMITNLEERITELVLDGVDPAQKLSQADAILYALPKLQGLLGTLTQRAYTLQQEGLGDANGSSDTFKLTTEGNQIFVSGVDNIILSRFDMDTLKFNKTRLKSFASTIAKEEIGYTAAQQDELKNMFKVLLGLIPPPQTETQEDEIPMEDEMMPPIGDENE